MGFMWGLCGFNFGAFTSEVLCKVLVRKQHREQTPQALSNAADQHLAASQGSHGAVQRAIPSIPNTMENPKGLNQGKLEAKWPSPAGRQAILQMTHSTQITDNTRGALLKPTGFHGQEDHTILQSTKPAKMTPPCQVTFRALLEGPADIPAPPLPSHPPAAPALLNPGLCTAKPQHLHQ
jgi:hypothetical protein